MYNRSITQDVGVFKETSKHMNKWQMRNTSNLLLLGAAAAGYYFIVRPWHRRWGATETEVAAQMPGDELVSGANYNTTRAITIHAKPAQVWPWLVQIGQGRGGMYSYDFLENLSGLNMHSAKNILPEYQDLKPGDTIPLDPTGGGYTVVSVKPEHLLVLQTPGEKGGVEEFFRKEGAASTWVFQLHALENGDTRLVCRWRARIDLTHSLQAFAIGVPLDPIEFLMEHRMLLGIKQRAESMAQ
jgi:hypothetical protein